MAKQPEGFLIIIGGHEDKAGNEIILKEVATRANRRSGALAIATVATQEPQEVIQTYRKVFRKLGVESIEHVNIRTREDAQSDENVALIKRSGVVFFTGGDQLRITSQIGDSPVFQTMQALYQDGGIIVGTSAGAAAMSETMVISGDNDKSSEISALDMAPGLGFISGVVVDSHFAERGRIGRLIGCVAQNPRNLGLGIDEDTAIIVHKGQFSVIGSGAVYVVDGTQVTYSSLSEKQPEGILSVSDLKLHVLAKGDKFNLAERQPMLKQQADEH
jgi:cyanophycinase